MKKILILLSLILLSSNLYAKNTRIKSFSQAKVIISKLYKTTFYCSCITNGYNVSKKGCDYIPKSKNYKNPYSIEYDHVLPTWKYKTFFGLKGNRRTLRKINHFALFESDIHNIVPSIKEINRAKRNYPFGMIKGEKREYGTCDYEKFKKVVEPKPNIRGRIARAYLYVFKEYFNIDPPLLYIRWNDKYQVTKEECRLSRKIGKIQGNHNTFTKKQCLKLNLWRK